jgi:hypothetical protein
MVTTRRSVPKIFSIAEANATLPLVRAITSDLVELSREVIERRQRLSLLQGGRNKVPGNPYHDELTQVERELEKDGRRLRELVEELRALGVTPTSGSEGLIDFPAILAGRKIFLCWKLGESEVLFWHEADAGFCQRKPLPAAGAAEGVAAGGQSKGAEFS